MVDADTPITDNGRELALQLRHVIDAGEREQAICSEICRLAGRHHRIQENQCNGYPDAAGNWDEEASLRDEAREAKLMERIVALARELPRWRDGRKSGVFGVRFGGDPRGATVKLTGPRCAYDSWGGDGVCVPIR